MSEDYRKGAMDLCRRINTSVDARSDVYGNRKSAQKRGSAEQQDQARARAHDHATVKQEQLHIMLTESQRIRPLELLEMNTNNYKHYSAENVRE